MGVWERSPPAESRGGALVERGLGTESPESSGELGNKVPQNVKRFLKLYVNFGLFQHDVS